MERQSITFLKYISIIQRNTSRYFDLSLEADQIGSGQQFFLLRIAENEGITMYDLARIGSFDKGTVTKAVQKLAQQGYVRIEVDEYDKRVRHLHITDRARAVIDRVYDLRDSWNAQLTADFTDEEREQVLSLLTRMAKKSCESLSKLMESKEEEKENA